MRIADFAATSVFAVVTSGRRGYGHGRVAWSLNGTPADTRQAAAAARTTTTEPASPVRPLKPTLTGTHTRMAIDRTIIGEAAAKLLDKLDAKYGDGDEVTLSENPPNARATERR